MDAMLRFMLDQLDSTGRSEVLARLKEIESRYQLSDSSTYRSQRQENHDKLVEFFMTGYMEWDLDYYLAGNFSEDPDDPEEPVVDIKFNKDLEVAEFCSCPFGVNEGFIELVFGECRYNVNFSDLSEVELAGLHKMFKKLEKVHELQEAASKLKGE